MPVSGFRGMTGVVLTGAIGLGAGLALRTADDVRLVVSEAVLTTVGAFTTGLSMTFVAQLLRAAQVMIGRSRRVGFISVRWSGY